MSLLHALLEEKKRRQALETPETPEAPDPQDYSVTEAVGGRFKTGVAQGVKSVGTGLQAVGTSMRYPHTPLTPQEYVAKHGADPDVGMSPTFLAAKAKTQEVAEKPTPQGLFPATQETSAPISVLTGKPVEPLIRETRRLREEEMSGPQKFVSKKLAPVVKAVGKPIAEFADRVIEDNPEWRLPEHLRGRGVLESMSADDLSIKDKATMLVGGIVQNTPQIAISLGLPVAGGLAAGPGGAIAGATVSAGGNFLNMSGEIYDELKHANPQIPEEDLANVALAHGTISAALEFMPQASLITKVPGLKKVFQKELLKELATRPSLAKTFISHAATQGITEGTTEALQQISGNVAKRVFDDNQKVFEGVGEAAFMGAVMGALTGGFESMGSHPSAVRQYNLEKVGEMNSDELTSLVNDPVKLNERGVSRAEAVEILRQVRATEQYEGRKRPPSTALETEKAVLEKRRAAVRTLREAELPDTRLETLAKSPEQLDQYGLKPADVEALQKERTGEQEFIQNFEATLESAPNENVRRGLLQTMQGEYYTKLKDRAVPEQAVPEQAVPEQAVPEQAVPEQAVVPEAAPEQAVVPEAAPEQAVVPAAAPEQAVVPAAAPEQAVVPAAAPEQAVVPAAAPEQAVPEQAVPEQAVPEQIGRASCRERV